MSGFLLRDGARLRIVEAGEGFPVLFQHGLGGDAAQVADNVAEMAGLRRITIECRGHGGSTAGDVRPFTIGLFADDVLAAADALGLDRFALGGISMGAAIALSIGARHPDRVAALVLARPAWLFAPAPDNMRPYAEVAAALRALPPDAARARFAASDCAAMLSRDAPDNLASLLGFFGRPDPPLTAELLADIAADGPGVTEAEARALDVPTLVIGHGVDHAHPVAFARALAATLPRARLVEIAPKATDRARHRDEFRAAVADFLAATLPLRPVTEEPRP